jgi:hypothetical protein
VWGSGDIAPPLVGSTLVGGEWLASCLCRFTAGETAPGTHCVGGWVVLRAGLDVTEKRKNIFPLPGIELWLLCCAARSLVFIPTELSLPQET